MSDADELRCCGVSELANIRDDDNVDDTIMNVYPDQQGLVVFTDINKDYGGRRINYRFGERLAKKIKDAKLGAVVCAPARKNPNSGHMVKVWTWALNRGALKSYQSKLKKLNPNRYYDDPYHYGGW